MSPQASLDAATDARIERPAEVLVVDDNEGMRKVMRYALEDAGYTVYEAFDGVEALAYLRTHRQGLIVLLDLNLPVLDGWSVLQAVAETSLADRHRFLLVTAVGDTLPPTLRSLLSQLRVPVIAKPFRLSHMLDAVAGGASAIYGHD